MIPLFPGTLRFGIGESFDKSSLSPYTTALSLQSPRACRHYLLTKDELIPLQVFAIGPSGMSYVDPADDPRKG